MSANDDDLSKTMVIPNPGGRRANAAGLSAQAQPTQPTSHTQALHQTNTPAHSVLDIPVSGSGSGSASGSAFGTTSGNGQISHSVLKQSENPLLANAADIINLASNIRTLQPNNTTEQLRFDINTQIERFNSQLSEQGVANEIALTARYLLCCLVDELVLSTPWGIESTWSRQTLLSKYHNETSGGEKFFMLINKLMEQAKQNIDLIELCYLCLSIGFRGKYRLSSTGENDIMQLCNMMHQAIALHRPVSHELSPSWRVQQEQHVGLEKKFPPSLIFLVLLFICITAYIALLSNLHAQSAGLFEKIETIAWEEPAPQSLNSASPIAPQSYTTIKQEIEQKLSRAINQGLLQITLNNDVLTLRFVSNALFSSGSVQVNESQLPERENLIKTIKQYTHSIVIVGHTDATGRADSNWVISRKRAESIEAWLKQSQHATLQMTTRGVADTQAISNDPTDSRNRRVEILIFLQEGSSNG